MVDARCSTRQRRRWTIAGVEAGLLDGGFADASDNLVRSPSSPAPQTSRVSSAALGSRGRCRPGRGQWRTSGRWAPEDCSRVFGGPAARDATAGVGARGRARRSGFGVDWATSRTSTARSAAEDRDCRPLTADRRLCCRLRPPTDPLRDRRPRTADCDCRPMTPDRRLQVFDILTPQRVDASTGQHRDSESFTVSSARGLRDRADSGVRAAIVGGGVSRPRRRQGGGRPAGLPAGGRRAGATAQASAVRRGVDTRRCQAQDRGGAARRPASASWAGELLGSDARERILQVGHTLRELAAHAVTAAGRAGAGGGASSSSAERGAASPRSSPAPRSPPQRRKAGRDEKKR